MARINFCYFSGCIPTEISARKVAQIHPGTSKSKVNRARQYLKRKENRRIIPRNIVSKRYRHDVLEETSEFMVKLVFSIIYFKLSPLLKLLLGAAWQCKKYGSAIKKCNSGWARTYFTAIAAWFNFESTVLLFGKSHF